MTVQLAWSFDAALWPTERPGLASPRVWAWRWPGLSLAAGRAMLAALILLYATLFGFTCARWCQLNALGATGLAAAHLGHQHGAADLGAMGAETADPDPGATVCRLQLPHPAGTVVPASPEFPVLLGVSVLTLLLLAAALPLAPRLGLTTPAFAPPRLPPRAA